MCVFWYPLSFRADKVSHVTWLEMMPSFQLVEPSCWVCQSQSLLIRERLAAVFKGTKRQVLWDGWIDAWMSSQLHRSVNKWCVWQKCSHFRFGCLYYRALADARSTGAGIICSSVNRIFIYSFIHSSIYAFTYSLPIISTETFQSRIINL